MGTHNKQHSHRFFFLKEIQPGRVSSFDPLLGLNLPGDVKQAAASSTIVARSPPNFSKPRKDAQFKPRRAVMVR